MFSGPPGYTAMPNSFVKPMKASAIRPAEMKAIGRPRSQRLLATLFPRTVKAPAGSGYPVERSREVEGAIGVITQKDPKYDDPRFHQLYQVGTLVTVLKKLKMPNGQFDLLLFYPVQLWSEM